MNNNSLVNYDFYPNVFLLVFYSNSSKYFLRKSFLNLVHTFKK